MAYVPINFVDGVTPLNAANLNHLEDAIEALDARPVGGADLSYDGDWVAGTYQDGDVVVKDGIAYLCVGGPTAVAPDPTPWGAGALAIPTYGTALPGSPVNGQEFILVDSLTNPTYQWRFRYNAGSTSPYKWEFIGGADFIHYIATGETTAVTGSFVDFATVGPRMIVPRAGDYDVDALVGVQHGAAPALVGFSSFKGTTTQGIGRTYSVPGSNYQGQIPQIGERWLGLAAGDDLRLRYVNYTAGTATFASRVIRVRPVRVA